MLSVVLNSNAMLSTLACWHLGSIRDPALRRRGQKARALLRRPVVRARRATGVVGPWELERMRPAPASSIRLQSEGNRPAAPRHDIAPRRTNSGTAHAHAD